MPLFVAADILRPHSGLWGEGSKFRSAALHALYELSKLKLNPTKSLQDLRIKSCILRNIVASRAPCLLLVAPLQVEKTLTQWKDFLPDAKDARHFRTPTKSFGPQVRPSKG